VREFVPDGGLISYGPSITEMTRRSAMFVDEILKGIKPTDLPIEQPTKFELAINLTTAKAVGLIVLPSLPARVDVTRSVGAMMDHPRRMKDTMADAYVVEGRGDDRRAAVPQRVSGVNCAVRANDVPNFVARTGVRRQEPCGNDEGDEGQTYLLEDRFTMDITATHPIAAPHDTSELGLFESARAENLNVETVTSNPLLPTDRKWAIRFNASGTVTIILGMKDYGRGWFSAYFAGIAVARLGIPFRRFRVYYSATLPAVLQTPVPSPSVFHQCHIGPIANAIADVVEGMCDQVIEKGRSAFAALAGVGVIDVGFDQRTGRFFVLERDRTSNIFEIVEATRGGSSVSIAFARRLRRGGKRVIADESQAPSAA
jgi:hypothetical protein